MSGGPVVYARGELRRVPPPGRRAAALWCPNDEIDWIGPHVSPDEALARRDRHAGRRRVMAS